MVSKFYAKSAQIILQSRIPAFASRIQCLEEPGANGCWFNLALGDSGPALEKLEQWCTGNLEPLVVDILVSQSSNVDKTRPLASPKQVHTRREGKSPILGNPEKHVNLSVNSSQRRIVLERWFVQFAGPTLKGNVKDKKATEFQDGHNSGKVGCSHKGSGKGVTYPKELVNVALKAHGKVGRATGKVETEGFFTEMPMRAIELPVVYKKIVIMLRSLYSTTRLLPAYSLFRLACSSRRCNFTLTHRILVSPPPLPESENKHMTQHEFKSIECHYGRICLRVAYRRKIPFTASETFSPMFTQIIPDYVSSQATDPLKRISTDCCSQGRSEKGGVHSVSILESGSPSCGCINCRGVKMVTVDEKGVCTTQPINEGHFCTLLPAISPFKSCGHAEDEELACPFAIDEQCDRMGSPTSAGCGRLSHKILQNAAVGTLVRMLKTAAPLQRIQQCSPSSTLLETSWSNADGDFKYLSDKKESSTTPERDHWPNKTTADALEELKLYKKMRDSLLS